MRKILYLVAALLVILPVAGCESTAQNFHAEGIEIKLAPIEGVSIMMLTSNPPQIQVYIKGGLADSCTTFYGLTTERSVNIFKITVTVQRPGDDVCAQVYTSFEKFENLGSDFVAGETYTVHVNDKTTSFIMPQQLP
jgi:hypothetical protein